MAKWHRREQKRWNKRQQRRREKQQHYSIICTKEGLSSVTPVSDPKVMKRYLAAHDYVPKGIEGWSGEQMREIAAKIVPDERVSWERALIMLAHHRSQLACDLIRELWDRAPEQLHSFCEQAYAEGLMWIGKSYLPHEEGAVIFEAPAGGGLPN